MENLSDDRGMRQTHKGDKVEDKVILKGGLKLYGEHYDKRRYKKAGD